MENGMTEGHLGLPLVTFLKVIIIYYHVKIHIYFSVFLKFSEFFFASQFLK